MSAIGDIPEVQALDSRYHLIRIPDQLDVPLTQRVQRIIDTAEFRRLAHISQLGLVSLVYPAAHHTRMEHCLGVYRIALLYLKQLSYDHRFLSVVSADDAQRFIVAALLHDLGHWPFCHPIEDIRLPGVPQHERFVSRFLQGGEIASILREEWGIEPEDVSVLLNKNQSTPTGRVLHSMLSGPIDIDKMDYLGRDSLHAGVPYGRNFDQQRLIGSLCLNRAGDGLAITDKGRTASEMMVFARYVMFSEVYWHHAVRSATAMLQRAFFLLHQQMDLDALFRMTERPMIREMLRIAGDGPAGELLGGIFGQTRRLYKRLAQFSLFQENSLYQQLARRPYPWLIQCAEQLAIRLRQATASGIATHDLLIDAPPVEREIEFDIEVYFAKEDCYRRLGDVSPVVKTLAQEQFDDYVKRVRIFIHPRWVSKLKNIEALSDHVAAAIETADVSLA